MKIDENSAASLLNSMETAMTQVLSKIRNLDNENNDILNNVQSLEYSKHDKFREKRPEAPAYSKIEDIPLPKYKEVDKEPSAFSKALSNIYEKWESDDVSTKIFIALGIFSFFMILNLILSLVVGDESLRIGAIVFLIVSGLGFLISGILFLIYVFGKKANKQLQKIKETINYNNSVKRAYEAEVNETNSYGKYLDELEKYKKSKSKFFEEHSGIEGKIEALKEKYGRNCEKLDKLHEEKNKVLDYLPEKYRNFSAVNAFISILRNKRARNLTETINVYEDDLHKRRLEDLAEERVAAEEQNIRINQARLEKEERFHESELKQIEERNREIERHNAEQERFDRENERRERENEYRASQRRVKAKCYNCPKYGICNLDPNRCPRR